MKTFLVLIVGVGIGFCLTLHLAKDSSVKDISEAQKTTHQVEATVSSAAHKAEKKSAKVYEALKSDDDETKVGHDGSNK